MDDAIAVFARPLVSDKIQAELVIDDRFFTAYAEL